MEVRCRFELRGAFGLSMSVDTYRGDTPVRRGIVRGRSALASTCDDPLEARFRQTDTKGPLDLSDGSLAEGSLCR
jgi:hypothetical protein